MLTEQQIAEYEKWSQTPPETISDVNCLALIASHREQAKMIETLKAERRLTLATAWRGQREKMTNYEYREACRLADYLIAKGER